MFSVVIPTLFAHDLIYKTLIQLSSCDSVGEIILIDNSTNSKTIRLQKLIHIQMSNNVYVNAAWNAGVQISNYDKICLLNDDIYFNWDFFSMIEPFIKSDTGFVGMHHDNFSDWQDEDMLYTDEFSLQKMPSHPFTKRGWRTEKWGSCIFFNKSDWDPIPDNLKIWAGDDWLFYRSKKENFALHGLKCFGLQSATINKLSVEDILQQDMSNMLELVKNGKVDNYLIGTKWWKD